MGDSHTDIAVQVRGVIASVALAWLGTLLFAFWFTLSGNTLIAGLALATQAALVPAVACLGWAHIKAVWFGGSEDTGRPILHGLVAAVITSFGAVWLAHALLIGPYTSH